MTGSPDADKPRTKWDVDFSFDVGLAERHHLSFHWRQAWAEASIEVDGLQVLKQKHPFGIRSVRRYQVSVGDSEHHSIVIEKRKPLAWGGIRKQSFRVLVDGKLVAEH